MSHEKIKMVNEYARGFSFPASGGGKAAGWTTRLLAEAPPPPHRVLSKPRLQADIEKGSKGWGNGCWPVGVS